MEDQVRERGEDARPAAGEHARSRRVSERQPGEDAVESGVVERARPIHLIGAEDSLTAARAPYGETGDAFTILRSNEPCHRGASSRTTHTKII